MIRDASEAAAVAALASLRRCDVGAARALALRRRCHLALRRHARPRAAALDSSPWTRRAGPAILISVGVVYLAATLRFAAGLFGL